MQTFSQNDNENRAKSSQLFGLHKHETMINWR